MKNPRKLLIAVAAFIGVVLLLLVMAPMFVDADRFRPMAESQARAALGREVKIGHLSFSLLRGGVVASDVSIADDPAFSRSPFLVAKGLNVGVQMWPLILSREVHVTSLTVEEPEISLVRAANGKWNFDSLGAKPDAPKPAGAKKEPAQNLSVEKLRVKDGRITVVQGGRKSVYEDVTVELDDFSMTSVFPFMVAAKTPGGGTMKFDGRAGPMSKGVVTQTPIDGEVSIKGMDLAKTGFLSPESGIAGMLDYQGRVKSDGKLLHSEGKATAEHLRVVKTGAPAQKPVTLDYASDLDLLQHRGTLTRGDILIGQSLAKLTGDFDTRGDIAAVNARLKGDALPLDSLAGLLPAFGVVLPQGTHLQGGTVNTDLQLQGPVDRLVTSGPIHVLNTRVNNFNLRSRASGISSLAGLPSGSDLLIQALNSKLRVAPEGVRADGIELVLPNIGSVTGGGIIGANNSLNFKMRAKLQGGGGLIGGMSTLSTLGQSKGEIPFLIQGTTSNPLFLPDVAGAIGNTMKAPVQGVQGVGGMLGGLFGKKKKDK